MLDTPPVRTPFPSFSRRRALGSIGAAGASLLASSLPASAFFFGKPKIATDLSGLPEAWMARQGRNLHGYVDFLEGLRLRHVSVRQVVSAHAKRHGSVWNSLPPKPLWKNIAATLRVIDRVGAELDQPVKEIVSAYRSPAYNARCSGAKRGSYHKSNVAVDVRFHSSPRTVSAVAKNLRSRGVYRGGVGRYYGFTHVDTRGYNVSW